MNLTSQESTPVPRWLRWWSLLTIATSLPLVILGAEVTTKRAGMVDHIGFRAPWYFFTLDLGNSPLGLLIEHGHRIFGFAVGICCIVLALGLTFSVQTWQRWLGWLALAVVSLQGVFGILRVNLNIHAGPELAAFHACFAQLALATLVSVAVLLSAAWHTPLPAGASRSTRRLALLLCVLVYTQIVFGAIVRHLFDPVAQRLHVILAFLVVALAVWVVRGLGEARRDPAISRVSALFLILLLLQPILGIEAWIQRFARSPLPELVPSTPGIDAVRSGHHVLGTMIFACSVALTLLVFRRSRAATTVQQTTPESLPVASLEGAA